MQRSSSFIIQFILVFLMGWSIFGYAEEIDPEEGDELVVSYCRECHSLARVYQTPYTKAQWEEAIDRMIKEGLEINSADRGNITTYLASLHKPDSILKLIGNFHFILVHFPIALILIIGLFELIAILTGELPQINLLHWLWRLALLSILPVIMLGFFLVLGNEHLSATLMWHRNLALLTALLTLVGLILREIAVKNPQKSMIWGYRLVLLLMMGAVGLTGHLGGISVHGDFVTSLMESFF
ncbi:MAG: hypothetical protein D6675_05615 [Gemmatimonadetes bacterium]|nr:MAG: hypothetical protein D6675_05615 [Gemmatimonadota bacterium]